MVNNPESNAGFITLARVVKTQGRHGEVAAEIHSDVPDRFTVGMKLFALPRENDSGQSITELNRASDPKRVERTAERVTLEIEDLWPHKGLLILKFAGIDSISDAATLIGSELQVSRADRAELERGWTYVSDLIGCAVFDHGREIGRIADVQFGAGEAPLLIVASRGQGGEVTKYDVPFAEAYMDGVDLKRHEVRMNLPEGMLDINAPLTAEEKQQSGSKQQQPPRSAHLTPRRKN